MTEGPLPGVHPAFDPDAAALEVDLTLLPTETVEEIKRAHDARVAELLAANNREVERRRAANVLLREAAAVFREYEGHHRAKASEAGRPEKAERNAALAAQIEVFLEGAVA